MSERPDIPINVLRDIARPLWQIKGTDCILLGSLTASRAEMSALVGRPVIPYVHPRQLTFEIAGKPWAATPRDDALWRVDLLPAPLGEVETPQSRRAARHFLTKGSRQWAETIPLMRRFTSMVPSMCPVEVVDFGGNRRKGRRTVAGRPVVRTRWGVDIEVSRDFIPWMSLDLRTTPEVGPLCVFEGDEVVGVILRGSVPGVQRKIPGWTAGSAE